MNRSHKIVLSLGGIASVVLLAVSIMLLARLDLGAVIGYAEPEAKKLALKMLVAALAMKFALSLWGLRLMLKDSMNP